MRLGVAAGGGAGLGLSGCTPSYVTERRARPSPGRAIKEGLELSDVRWAGANRHHLSARRAVRWRCGTRTRNGGSTEQRVRLTGYEVRYFRRRPRRRGCGRAVWNHREPHDRRRPPRARTRQIQIEVVRRQAKLGPPLGAIHGAAVVATNGGGVALRSDHRGQHVTAQGSVPDGLRRLRDRRTSCESRERGEGRSDSSPAAAGVSRAGASARGRPSGWCGRVRAGRCRGSPAQRTLGDRRVGGAAAPPDTLNADGVSQSGRAAGAADPTARRPGVGPVRAQRGRVHGAGLRRRGAGISWPRRGRIRGPRPERDRDGHGPERRGVRRLGRGNRCGRRQHGGPAVRHRRGDLLPRTVEIFQQ